MVLDTVRNWLGVEAERGIAPMLGERAATIVKEAIEDVNDLHFQLHCRSELVGFGLGVKPAVFLNGYKLGDPQTVREIFQREGAAISCDREIVINERAVLDRVRSEPELARAVGWNPAQSALEQFQESVKHLNRARDSMRIGFILGVPGSAIRSFDAERRIKDLKGSLLPAQLFGYVQKEPMDPDWKSWFLGMDDSDVESLRAMAEEYDLTNQYVSSLHPSVSDRLEAEAHDQFYAKHDQALRRIYGKYTTITDDEASLFMSRRRKRIFDPNGSSVYTFITHGDEGRNAPDVRRLETKVRNAFQSANGRNTNKPISANNSRFDAQIA